MTTPTTWSQPTTLAADCWKVWGTGGTHLRLVGTDGYEANIAAAEYPTDQSLVITTVDGQHHRYAIDEQVMVRRPVTTFAAIRAAAGMDA